MNHSRDILLPLDLLVGLLGRLGGRARKGRMPGTGAKGCPECSASGKCRKCGGRGKLEEAGNRAKRECFECEGSKRCWLCAGRAEVTEEIDAARRGYERRAKRMAALPARARTPELAAPLLAARRALREWHASEAERMLERFDSEERRRKVGPGAPNSGKPF